MIHIIPIFCFVILQYSRKFLRKIATSNVFWIIWMLEIPVRGMLFCPQKQCSIHLNTISLTLFILLYPNSYIHAMFFWTIESGATKKLFCNLIENIALKYLSILDFFYHFLKKARLFFKCWRKWWYPQISICKKEFFSHLLNKCSALFGKWQ